MSNNKKNNSLIPFGVVVAALVILIAATFGAIRNSLNLGLDLVGGFEILYEVTPLEEETAGTAVDMSAVTNSIQKRVNVLGVSEPMITVEGNNRVRVQLAGVADQESAREMIGTTANLTFRDVNDELLSDSSIITEGGASLAYQDGRPIVSLKIADQSKFAEITADVSSRGSGNNIMIIWLDWEEGDTYKEEYSKSLTGQEPKYISAATVRGTINGDCIIEGNKATEGGGGVCYSVLEDCQLKNNVSECGGGAYMSILRRCLVSRNEAIGLSGGGMKNSTAYDCVVQGNAAATFMSLASANPFIGRPGLRSLYSAKRAFISSQSAFTNAPSVGNASIMRRASS